ncbi:MAG: inorganic phosphate transporter [Eubacteriales bacterium]|nr:inorganic phosphate transporter [Eubacteriales bacterium]
MTLTEYLSQLSGSSLAIITALLTLGVILVNGWTDAPNAIATCVSTRSITPRSAIMMAAVFNFLGVFVMTLINSEVASTISNMVRFGSNAQNATTALCAALFAIVVWATAAWKFGIPTSESHALIAGLSGAAIAIKGDTSAIVGAEWIKVVYGLGLSTALGFFAGYISSKGVELAFKASDRVKTNKGFKIAQNCGGAFMAFMHGAQDGQKFMGVFLLGAALSSGDTTTTNFQIPIWLMILCSIVMGLGTSMGGYKIIKSVGMDMVKLKTYQGFAADTAAAFCLLLASLTGIPVSTTHTKTSSIMGVGFSKRASAVNWKIVGEMVMTWVLTFPGCGLLAYGMVKLFLLIF